MRIKLFKIGVCGIFIQDLAFCCFLFPILYKKLVFSVNSDGFDCHVNPELVFELVAVLKGVFMQIPRGIPQGALLEIPGNPQGAQGGPQGAQGLHLFGST